MLRLVFGEGHFYYERGGSYYDAGTLTGVPTSVRAPRLIAELTPGVIARFTSTPVYLLDDNWEYAIVVTDQNPLRLRILFQSPNFHSSWNDQMRFVVPDPATMTPLPLPPFDPAVYDESEQQSDFDTSFFQVIMSENPNPFVELIEDSLPDFGLYYLVNRKYFYGMDLQRIPDEVIFARWRARFPADPDPEFPVAEILNNSTTILAINQLVLTNMHLIYFTDQNDQWHVIEQGGDRYVVYPSVDTGSTVSNLRLIVVPSLSFIPGDARLPAVSTVTPNLYFEFERLQEERLSIGASPLIMDQLDIHPPSPPPQGAGRLFRGAGGPPHIITVPPSREEQELGRTAMEGARRFFRGAEEVLRPQEEEIPSSRLTQQSLEQMLRHLYGIPAPLPRMLPVEGVETPLISYEEAIALLQSGQIRDSQVPPLLQPWGGPPGTHNRIILLIGSEGNYLLRAKIQDGRPFPPE